MVFIEMLSLTTTPPPYNSMTPFILPEQSKCDMFHPKRPLALFPLIVSGANFEPPVSQCSHFFPHGISPFNDYIFQFDNSLCFIFTWSYFIVPYSFNVLSLSVYIPLNVLSMVCILKLPSSVYSCFMSLIP